MEVTKEIEKVLSCCSIFDQIPADKYKAVLFCLHGNTKSFDKDENIINIGEYRKMSGIVISGTVEVSFFDENGNQISVNHIGPGQTFGAERACCDWEASPIRLNAVSACTLLFMDFSILLQPDTSGCQYRARVTANLLRDFARQTQFLNLKLRILGQKHLRDKIKVYLQSLPVKEDEIVLPYNRRELSEFLYADRSALCRELTKMQDEQIIEYSGKKIKLLDKDFLKM